MSQDKLSILGGLGSIKKEIECCASKTVTDHQKQIHIANIKNTCLKLIKECMGVNDRGYYHAVFINVANNYNKDINSDTYFVFSVICSGDNKHYTYSIWNRHIGTVDFMKRECANGSYIAA